MATVYRLSVFSLVHLIKLKPYQQAQLKLFGSWTLTYVEGKAADFIFHIGSNQLAVGVVGIALLVELYALSLQHSHGAWQIAGIYAYVAVLANERLLQNFSQAAGEQRQLGVTLVGAEERNDFIGYLVGVIRSIGIDAYVTYGEVKYLGADLMT